MILFLTERQLTAIIDMRIAKSQKRDAMLATLQDAAAYLACSDDKSGTAKILAAKVREAINKAAKGAT